MEQGYSPSSILSPLIMMVVNVDHININVKGREIFSLLDGKTSQVATRLLCSKTIIKVYQGTGKD